MYREITVVKGGYVNTIATGEAKKSFTKHRLPSPKDKERERGRNREQYPKNCQHVPMGEMGERGRSQRSRFTFVCFLTHVILT